MSDNRIPGQKDKNRQDQKQDPYRQQNPNDRSNQGGLNKNKEDLNRQKDKNR